MKAHAIGFAFAALLAVAAPAAAHGIHVGEMAPDAKITLVGGSTLQLSQLRGQVVVLNFWATWCAPCREELPLLDFYYGAQKKAGLRVFAVTTEDSAPIGQLKRLFAEMQIPPARQIGGPYATVTAVPTNYVIDRAGRLRYAKAGSFTLDDLNAIIVPLLREPAPVPTPL